VAFLVVAVVVGIVFALQGLSTEPDGRPAAAHATANPAGTPSATPVPSLSPTPTNGVPARPTTLRAKHSSLCLDIAPGGDAAVQAPCSGAATQLWTATPTATPADGGASYLLVNSATGKCLDVADSRQDDGVAIRPYQCQGQANQQWRISVTAGFATVVSVNSGKCLDVARISKDPGTEVHQWTCLGADNQLWAFAPQP
jgi:hypothetical protein